jgi:hypothetical protein
MQARYHASLLGAPLHCQGSKSVYTLHYESDVWAAVLEWNWARFTGLKGSSQVRGVAGTAGPSFVTAHGMKTEETTKYTKHTKGEAQWMEALIVML